MPLVNLTLAIFRSAEFGFLGVVVETFVQTPRLKGAGKKTGLFFKTLNPFARATVLCLAWTLILFFLINWLIVGIDFAKSRRASRFSATTNKIALIGLWK